MVNHLVIILGGQKPLFFIILGAHGIWNFLVGLAAINFMHFAWRLRVQNQIGKIRIGLEAISNHPAHLSHPIVLKWLMIMLVNLLKGNQWLISP